MSSKKDQSIETLRGLAIILMVMGHVIGSVPDRGLSVSDDSLYRYIYHSLEYIRMPLFTAISGFVYALRPVQSHAIIKFFKGKLRRLLLPLITVSTIHFMALLIIPGTNRNVELQEIWKIYFYGFEHFWFLQAIITVFITIIGLEVLGLLKNFKTWFVCLISAFIASVFIPKLGFFSFDGYLFLLPYFILGYGFNCHWQPLQRKLISYPLIIAFVVSVGLQQLVLFNKIDFTIQRFSIVAIMIAVSGNFLLFKFRFHIKWLAYLGGYAYGIYLFHVFPAAGTRIMLKKVGIYNTEFLFIACLLMGLIAPLVFEKIAERSKILRLTLFGLK